MNRISPRPTEAISAGGTIVMNAVAGSGHLPVALRLVTIMPTAAPVTNPHPIPATMATIGNHVAVSSAGS